MTRNTGKKLRKGDKFPSIKTVDIFGRPIDISTSTRMLVSFMRNVDCALCNYQIQLINEAHEKFKATETEVVIFMQSTAEEMRVELTGEVFDIKLPLRMVADPEKKIYNQISSESSWLKYARVVFLAWPIYRAKQQGHKIKLRQRGEQHLMPADFLIDRQGIVLNAHYGKHVADHMPFEEIFDTRH